jgi:hypothetical protein
VLPLISLASRRLASRYPVDNPSLRQILLQLLNFATVISSGLIAWKFLSIVTNSESPVVVVLSWVSRAGQVRSCAHVEGV